MMIAAISPATGGFHLRSSAVALSCSLSLAFLALPRDAFAMEVRTASAHPMKYQLSLPGGWTAAKRWPVVVVIADASRDFKGVAESFEKARGHRPYIIVAPHVLTSGGSSFPRTKPLFDYDEPAWAEAQRAGDFGFDEPGIAAVVHDVQKLYGGEDKYFLTGWEAGGHTVWAMLFRHPEVMKAAAPVSPNYRGRWLDGSSESSSPARGALPVKILLFGQEDPSASAPPRSVLVDQAQKAMQEAAARGFRNVSLETVPGARHGPLADAVLAFFDSTRSR